MPERLLTYNQRTLRAIWDGWDNNRGVFHFLAQKDFSFVDLLPMEELDFDYYLFQSGRKQSTSAILNLLNDENLLTDASRELIAGVIYNRYHDKWERVFKAFVNEYTPFTTYADNEVSSVIGNATETASRDKSHSGTSLDERQSKTTDIASGSSNASNNDTGSASRATSANDSSELERQGTESKTRTGTGNNTAGNGIFGFNSSSAVGSTEQEGEQAYAEVETVAFEGRKDATANERAETETNLHSNATETQSTESATGQTESDVTGSRTDSANETEAEKRERDTNRTRTLARTGFNKPIADLILDYIELWKTDFYQIMFRDVDAYLALSVY